MHLGVCAALGVERRQVGEREYLTELRQRSSSLVDLRALVIVLADDADGARMLEDIGDVVRRGRGVDRRRYGSHVRQGEVGQRPVEARPGQDPVGVALAETAGEEAVRPRLDGRRRLSPRHRAPAVLLASEVRGVSGRQPVDGVTPQAGNRALRWHDTDSRFSSRPPKGRLPAQTLRCRCRAV